jgi:hypothetical protein
MIHLCGRCSIQEAKRREQARLHADIDLNFRARPIDEAAVGHEFRVFMDLSRIRWLQGNKSFRKFYRRLIYWVVGRKTNVEKEIESPKAAD